MIKVRKIMTISRLCKNKGFTLLEIMIAVFLLTFAMLGVISVTVTVIKGNSFSKTMTTATTLAKDRMEQLKNTSYTSLLGGSDTQDIYTRTWTVQKDIPTTGMATIQVKVEWNWQGTSHNVVLRNIAAQ